MCNTFEPRGFTLVLDEKVQTSQKNGLTVQPPPTEQGHSSHLDQKPWPSCPLSIVLLCGYVRSPCRCAHQIYALLGVLGSFIIRVDCCKIDFENLED